MTDTIQRLRAHARELARDRDPRGVRYPAAFRAAAVGLVGRGPGRRAALARVARELGLPARSLARWVQQPARPILRPVTIDPAVPPAPVVRPVLLTAHGVRVEGLDVEALVVVLKALA
jgi:transposase-like protein